MEDFCKFYADDSRKLLYSDILEKRKRAITKINRRILSSSEFNEINESNFLKVVNAGHLEFIARQIDAEFFDNNLFKTFEKRGCCMTFCMGNTCGSAAGRCSYRKGFKPEERVMLNIKMMPKVFIKSFKDRDIKLRAVDNLPCEDILTCFFITLCHEMVHGIVFCNCKEFDKTNKGPGSWKGATQPGNGHNKTFMSILNNRFGHTKFVHNLKRGVTVEQLEKEVFGQHNVKKGDLVVLKVRQHDGSHKETEVLILSATKLQIKAQVVGDPSKVYKGRFYGAILRKVTYPKKTTTPVLNVKPEKKIKEIDLEEEKPKPKVPFTIKPKTSLNKTKKNNLVKSECNKRNPAPPCGPGMYEKKRPNGSVCCYKGVDPNKTKKKNSTKPVEKPTPLEKPSASPKKVSFKFKIKNVVKPSASPKKVSFKFKNKNVAKTQKNNIVKPASSKSKAECNKRNPAPPCGAGMVEKKRPNGSICCYKGEKPVLKPKVNTTKKPAVKTQKKTNNNNSNLQEKLYELDFAYKPVSLNDLDSHVNFKSFSPELKKYIKSLPTFNWNKPLAEKRNSKSENPYLHDLNKMLSDIKNKFYIVKISETEDMYGKKDNEQIILVRNEGSAYVRYGIRITNYPKSAFLKTGKKLW